MKISKPFALIVLLHGTSLFQPLTARGETPKLTFEVIERFRFVAWDNAIDLDADADNPFTFTRHRTSLGALFTVNPSLSIYAKLTNEFRYWFRPDDRDFKFHEVFFDNLFVEWKRPAGVPLNLKLGRQNMNLGEGFVVMDGHPLDGSRSIYFNAARADWLLSDHHRLILFYTYQPETDDILPVINNQNQPLIEQPEEGIGLYFAGQFGKTNLDLYAIRKNILCGSQHLPSSGINTVGFRTIVQLTNQLSVTGEAARQFGSLGGAIRRAWGGYAHADYYLKRRFPVPSVITLGAVFLGGDDPKTPKWEGWDPLFSRWPKWSESYIYALIPEYGGHVAYWSNWSSFYTALAFQIVRPVELTIHLHRLGAPVASDAAAGFPGGGGHVRGTLLITKLIFRLSKTVTGHLLWDVFSPGDYYFSGADGFHWFRCELLYNWR